MLTPFPSLPPKTQQTDTSRAQLAEAQVQARVAAELRKLEADASARLSSQLGSSLLPPDSDSSSPDSRPGTSRQQVAAEIEALRRRLETRRVVRDVPAAVEAARSDVVRCLREHDRRPLDCWREVEAFKEQVRRLEKGWVERVVS